RDRTAGTTGLPGANSCQILYHRGVSPWWCATTVGMFYRLTGSAKQWPVLAMISTAQLMVVLDISIGNVARPSMQSVLGFTAASREWVVTSYALAFGSLLLLGGRLTELFGPKRSLLAGLVGFAAAPALGGAAPSFRMR